MSIWWSTERSLWILFSGCQIGIEPLSPLQPPLRHGPSLLQAQKRRDHLQMTGTSASDTLGGRNQLSPCIRK